MAAPLPNLPKPTRPYFASGPCVKFKMWSFSLLEGALLGQSHRSAEAVNRLRQSAELIKSFLNIPKNYHVVFTPGSATGAFTAAMYNFLGPKPLNVVKSGTFSKRWYDECAYALQNTSVNYIDQNNVEPNADTLFVLNETAETVWFNNVDWLAQSSQTLSVCDATSAAFGVPIDFSKLDLTFFGLQKCLGCEASFGVLVLSPKALQRLEEFSPDTPIPRLFRLKENDTCLQNWFEHKTINTISLLLLEELYQVLLWLQKNHTIHSLYKKVIENADVINNWLPTQSNYTFSISDKNLRSPLGVRLEAPNANKLLSVIQIAQNENVAHNIRGFTTLGPHIRIWTGPTVEKDDLLKLTYWLDWLYNNV